MMKNENKQNKELIAFLVPAVKYHLNTSKDKNGLFFYLLLHFCNIFCTVSIHLKHIPDIL